MEVEGEEEANNIVIEAENFDYDSFLKLVSEGNIEEVNKLLVEG